MILEKRRILEKNSYGTKVISNAENVISTETKTYPSTGAVKLTSNAHTITSDNALVRLPSNAFKVNYVQLCAPIQFGFAYNTTGNGADTVRVLQHSLMIKMV